MQTTIVFSVTDSSGLEKKFPNFLSDVLERQVGTYILLSFAFVGTPLPLAFFKSTSHSLCASAKLTNSNSGHSLANLEMDRSRS